ncbi:Transmembrane protein C30D11.06c like [Verticillium longisporum]|nr:Transmembrane protein C30D11.06c like [Verticillium longisporum]
MAGGTGQKLTTATTIVAGVAALVATLLSIVSITLQAKNYRKPLLQRYVVRILLMVPIYSIASWTSMISLKAAQFVDPVRDIYEAFTIYTFFHLLINYLGGERSLIIMTHGREPVSHLWPMNHVLPRVDISDPHTFLAIKRGILQYAWLKPVLSVASIIMKATGTYQEGYIGLSSGYLWSGIVYNVSVTLSLYSLGLFWVCMHRDLLPFRPVPKFLCIKLIIFASYWQGFLLSILVWLGAIPDSVEGYTPDNLAAAIQDALICIEMPVFAVAHWYAFSWHDFADRNVLAARMPVKFAFRDAFGIRDLIEDTKQTFSGDQYNYRIYDSGDKIMPHEESRARLGRLKEGMRYQRGGKGKYWIPTPGQVDRQVNHDLNERDPLLAGTAGGPSEEYNFENGTFHDIDEENKDPEEEELYAKARELEYGDWNYPVITAHEPLRERYARAPDGNYRYQPSRPQGTRAYSQNSHQSSEPSVVSSRPKKQKQKQKQKRIPAPKLSGQGLVPDHSSPTAGPAATSSNVSTPRVQSPKPVHATAAESESAGTLASSKTKDDRKKPAATPQKQAAPHESSPWANKDESEDEPDLRFRVGDEEEFRNVWDGGDQRDHS